MSSRIEGETKYEVTLLSPAEVLAKLPFLERFIAPAFERAHGELQAIDAIVLATEGKALFFVGSVNGIINAALIVETVQYPRLKVLNFLAYAGKMRGFYWFYQEIETWARQEGYDELRGFGDEATMRLARKVYGWNEIYRVYAKPLR